PNLYKAVNFLVGCVNQVLNKSSTLHTHLGKSSNNLRGDVSRQCEQILSPLHLRLLGFLQVVHVCGEAAFHLRERSTQSLNFHLSVFEGVLPSLEGVNERPQSVSQDIDG